MQPPRACVVPSIAALVATLVLTATLRQTVSTDTMRGLPVSSEIAFQGHSLMTLRLLLRRHCGLGFCTCSQQSGLLLATSLEVLLDSAMAGECPS